MTPTQVVALCVRLFAIGLVFYCLMEARWIFYADEFPVTPLMIVAIVALILVVVFLWLFPMSVASRIVRSDLADVKTGRWSESELYCFGFVLAGFVFLLSALSDAVYGIALAVALSREGTSWALTVEDKAGMATTVVECILAILLIFGAQGLQRLVFRVRYGKLPEVHDRGPDGSE